MTAADSPKISPYAIADIERDTGVPKDTLRVWERRYGFPDPVRDAKGERRYDDGHLLRLRHIRRLLDGGRRPGQVVRLTLEQLLRLDVPLAGDPVPVPVAARVAPDDAPDLDHWIHLLRQHKARRLHTAMSQHLLTHGLGALVRHGIAPMNEHVGQAWLDGQIAVFEEHLYTETAQRQMRAGLSHLVASRALHPPRVLLTTVPGELHGLGLLMAECMLMLEGCETVSLGLQTPLVEVADAARLCRADVVALGFSPALNPREARATLVQMQALLPDHVALWTGGLNPGLQRRPPALANHTHMPSLADIGPAVARWRAARSPEGPN